mmetsp:Transcript_23016/g.41540  ORF Transcript_23016/g.41540 Transcript_23016/m.41540 type:complete len:265 (+) Transcript_23016:2075-2869(+)
MPWVQQVVPRVREGPPLRLHLLHHHVEGTRITRVVGVRIVVVEEEVVADGSTVTKRRLIMTRTEVVVDIEVTTTITDRVRNMYRERINPVMGQGMKDTKVIQMTILQQSDQDIIIMTMMKVRIMERLIVTLMCRQPVILLIVIAVLGMMTTTIAEMKTLKVAPMVTHAKAIIIGIIIIRMTIRTKQLATSSDIIIKNKNISPATILVDVEEAFTEEEVATEEVEEAVEEAIPVEEEAVVVLTVGGDTNKIKRNLHRAISSIAIV